MNVAGLCACGLLVGCGASSPTRPTPPPVVATVAVTVPTPPPPARLAWVISGQSNAVGCATGAGPAGVPTVLLASGLPATDHLPFMEPYPTCDVGPWVWAAQAYGARSGHPVTLTGWGRVSSPIDLWRADHDGWSRLRAAIPLHADVFLWWQGESDAVLGTHEYTPALADLIARVRAAADNPAMLVVVIGLADAEPADAADFARLRAQQAAVVAADAHALLVPAQGLPRNPAQPYHLTADGYAAMGQRIAAALPY